ncbi:wax ester/triacylglycerol synthase family O-acyltransferase [Microlunatus elymi]|uniref:Diacylglycerol O-acyltransferase n=1 Tax=Microlunatus elymi TaxID=2596828 RepID=A0A516PYZ9_9ACTN|nr:wax ester/triacylglycerol synthase family O-acyltransferase [Microlunatus elymi]QDP96409.1 wax ester/triacylglycerol synthase family O-acyltransferase [Microlunatus elymi]
MPERLTAAEQATLTLDGARTPAAVGTVAVFSSGPSGFDFDRLIDLIRDRIRYVPRYRQRILSVPGRLAEPVWVDDGDFDLTFHVRRAAVPRPGNPQQLREFAERVLSRRMDRSRPLWELYLVERLEHDQFALVAKTHPSVVDGIDTVDLVQVLLEDAPSTEIAPEESWHPLPAPTTIELVVGALNKSVQNPAGTVSNLQNALTDAYGTAVSIGEAVGRGEPFGDLVADALRGARTQPQTPLTGSVGDQRRIEVVPLELDDLRAIGTDHDQDLHDVLLAVITGGFRTWLMTRGEIVTADSTLTALVPISVVEDDASGVTSLGSRVVGRLTTLPIGEPNASARLQQLGRETQPCKESGQPVSARELAELAGFAPPTLHALGTRSAAAPTSQPYDVLISNAPGPQAPVYLGVAELSESYPVLPLTDGHLLAIGITSYQGKIMIGLNADRDAFDDLEVLAQCITDALEDLRPEDDR